MRKRCPMTTERRPRPEPISSSGEVILSHNHIAFLHGLYDRPNGVAESTTDLIRAAEPYLQLFESTLNNWNTSVRAWKMNPAWATREKVRNRMVWRLTDRGRAIIEQSVPARIRGYGVYRGLTPIRAVKSLHRRRTLIEARWTAAIQHAAFQRFQKGVERLVRLWGATNAPPPSYMSSARHHYFRQRVRLFLRDYVLRHGELPSGRHNIAPGWRLPQFYIDFDLLRHSAARTRIR